MTFKLRERPNAPEASDSQNVRYTLAPSRHLAASVASELAELTGRGKIEKHGEEIVEGDAGDNAIRDAELLLASLRMLLLMALALVPFVYPVREAYGSGALILMAVAGVYNIFTIVASIYPGRFRLRRALIVTMDATLISAWIHISGRFELLPFYYVVVVVAAMWYRVLGGVLMAAVCNFLWLMLWVRPAATGGGVLLQPNYPMALNSVLFFVIGALAGYIAEAQDRERERSLERELLIANYQQEIDLSGELQPLLLSRPEKGGVPHDLDIGAALQSARSVGGGDYLDAIPLADGATLLCIADVSGKSIRAQARVPLLKYSLRALAPLHPQPAELMARLQTTLLPDLAPELYIAICLVVVDSKLQLLTWCNAGHLAPLLIRASGAISDAPFALAATAPALGLFPELKITQKSVAWKKGDALLMFTDGLPDALSYGGEFDGEAQVNALALGLRENGFDAETMPTSAEAAQELVALAGVALGDKPFVARHFTLARSAVAKSVHRDDVAVLIARNVQK